jgi:F-BAR domain only protein
LLEPGLNASIIETVNAWFVEGMLTKSFVVGELALAYNPVGEAPQRKRIRLDNFPVLEKVAANPHFITEVSLGSRNSGREPHEDEVGGQYSVSLSNILRPIPTVAFKYQVHLDPLNLSSYCPIIFTPAWNLEEFQASVIISYRFNPSFISASLESIILKDFVLTVNLDISSEDEVTKQPREVARATGAAMYPSSGASFRRKQSTVLWKMPELEIRAGVDGKFLARFTTSTSWPRKGVVEAKFEYRAIDAASRLGISVASDGDAQDRESDPFADEMTGTAGSSTPSASMTWKGVPTMRKLAAGKYISS